MPKKALTEIIQCASLHIPVLVLLIIPDQRPVLIPQSDHIDVLIFIFIAEGIDDIVVCALRKPRRHLFNLFPGLRVVAV